MDGLATHGRVLASNRMENASTLVLGMGVGTFIVFFFAILLFFVFVFTGPCTKVEKIVWRSVTFAIFGIIILILIFAEKETQFYYTTVTPSAYDYKIIPRIAIGCVAILFGIISGIFIIEHTGENRELSTVDHEPTALWQH